MLFTSVVHAKTVNFGVFTYRSAEKIKEEYVPIAEYLSQKLDMQVIIKPLSQKELEKELAAGHLDIVATNPTHYLSLQKQKKTTGAIATLVKEHQKHYTSYLGGVIITHKDTKNIDSLQDLKGKHIAIPGKAFLGGYLSQVYELVESNININEQLTTVSLKSHNAVVNAVLNKEVDAGFIRTGILEEMADEAKLNINDFKILNPQEFSYFPLKISTRLYPEWAIVAAQTLDVQSVSKIAVALYGYETQRRGNNIIVGFTIPGDYVEIDTLARTLRIPPYEEMPHFTSKDIFEKFGANILLIVSITALFFLTLTILYKRTRDQRKYAQSIINAAPNPTIICDSHETISANTAFLKLIGFSSFETFKSKHKCVSDFFDEGDTDEYLHTFMHGSNWIEYILKNPDIEHKARIQTKEKMILCRVKASLLESGKFSSKVIITFDDISLLVCQLTTDALTKIPNRMHFDLMYKYAFHTHLREKKPLSLVFFDVDHFKKINDTYGHLVGDEILYKLAQFVRAELRKSDTVARWGGEEFVLLLPNTALGDASRLAQSLCDKIAHEPLSEHSFITSSFGVVQLKEGERRSELLARADALLYEAKTQGRNRVVAQ